MSSYSFFIAAGWGDAAVPEHFQALAHRLVERGHRVVYLPHGQQVSIDEGNFHVRSFPSPRPTKPQDFIFLHKLVREYQPDCMIANFGAVNVMNIVGRLNRVPCRVDWYHSLNSSFEVEDNTPYWKKKFYALRKRVVYKLSTHIAAVSAATRDDLVSTYAIAPRRTHIVYNTLGDPLQRMNVHKTCVSSRPILTCAGGLFPWKGQDVAIKAIKLLHRQFPQVKIELIGDGPKYKEYLELIDTNGLKECCILLGKLSHMQTIEHMYRSCVVIVPSRQDSFPYVVLEAMAVGTPVIASQVGGIPEAIRDGVDGFLVPPDDPEALAEKIGVLLSKPALREQMGRNARQRFLDVFEQTQNIEQQALWFEELVQQARA